MEQEKFGGWLLRNWSRAGLVVAFWLLLLSPFLRRSLNDAAFAAWLQLPAYMLHQYEEHAQGRFKAFVNAIFAGGRELLSDAAIFWINILTVWAALLGVLYLASELAPAAALLGAYLSLVNGLLHLAFAARLRRSNPGVWTSLLILVPSGGAAAFWISRKTGAPLLAHALCLALVLLMHALLGLWIWHKVQRLQTPEV